MAVGPIGPNMLWPMNCGVAGVLRCPSAGGVGGCVGCIGCCPWNVGGHAAVVVLGGCVGCIGCCPWNVGGYVALALAAVVVLGGSGCTGPVPVLATAPSGAGA